MFFKDNSIVILSLFPYKEPFFSFVAFKIFFVFKFYQFDWDVYVCVFPCIFSFLSSLRILDLWFIFFH